jgi:hypothetical protein
MRRLEESPIDPEIAAALDAIDATLAGEPVAPEHAELAELALLVRAERPAIGPEFATSLDERVARRFAARAPATSRRRWLIPTAGLASASVAAVAFALVLGSGSSSPSAVQSTARPAIAPATASGAASSASSPPAVSSSAAGSSLPAAPPTPRKVVQSAQLALTSPANRVDDVAQEVFDAIGRAGGVVNSSTVTATGGPDGYAQFQLTVPSSALSQTMASLSSLRYAGVASRTDTTQDVTDQFSATTRALADARALRTSLLKQLATAATQSEIDSLKAQINDAEASISSDQATLRRLGRQVGYSQIALTINARPIPVASGGSFTIGRAAHDAGRVLTVAAGVALIALAAAVPFALLGALWWWIATTLRRRRREQALDAL